MVLYDDIYIGTDPILSEKKNFKSIISSLAEAKKNGQSFYLLSSSIVFDRSVKKRYTESSIPNSKSFSAKLLIEAEKQVLQYQNGFVYRIQDLMSRFFPLFEAMRDFKGVPVIPRERLFFLSDDFYAYLLNDALIGKSLFQDDKIIHLSVPNSLEFEFIWFVIRKEDPFDCDENSSFDISKNDGYIESEKLSSNPLYKDFLEVNRKYVVSTLRRFCKEQ